MTIEPPPESIATPCSPNRCHSGPANQEGAISGNKQAAQRDINDGGIHYDLTFPAYSETEEEDR